MNKYTKEIQLFKALSHPARIAILEILRNGEQCVCHIEATLGLRQAYISQQLMALRKAGILAKRREGWNIYYRVTDAKVYILLDSAYQITGMPRSLAKVVPSTCTCPNCVSDAQEMMFIPELEI